MRYIGYKSDRLPHIEKVIASLEIQGGVFCDLFAGTASVAAHFKQRGFQIISNDLLELSYTFQRSLIATNEAPAFARLVETLGDVPDAPPSDELSSYQKVIAWLNCLPGRKGFIFHNYCPSGNNEYGRQYLSDFNGQKIDAIRQQLQVWRDADEVTADEFYLLLLPLLEATSRVANISETYSAYLKEWNNRARKDLTLATIDIIPSDLPHQTFRRDANDLISEIRCDVLYLDPPDNTRQYLTDYHLLETIARYDAPKLRGKAGIRYANKAEKSAYCSKARCLEAFRALVEQADTKYILMSYHSAGILSEDEIMEVLSLRGTPHLDSSIDDRRCQSHSRGKAKRSQELLFYLEVTTPPQKAQSPKKPKRRYDPRNRLNNLSGAEWTYFLNSVELHENKKLNNLSETEWMVDDAPVWETCYPTTGFRSDAHHIRREHPSPKPPQLMKRLLEFFTKKGGRVLDPFAGVGGTLLACSMTGRYGVGIELSTDYLRLYHRACDELGLEPQKVFCGDAQNLAEILPDDEPPFDLVLTDPPYSDMLSRKRTGEQKKRGDNSPTPFTADTADLGNMTLPRFYASLQTVIEASMQFLKPKGYLVLFCKDLQPTEAHHNMIHADVVSTLTQIENLRFRGYKIWYDRSQRLYPFGYPYAYVSNQLHQFILIFRKEK